ncbi:hypothetical protein JZ751_026716 [Albula glossodonta]|uniref:Fe2OG dioxygenase domain-containing protein n=1 Tax=Albula glossodonta TaxID=121402 RepID=A0A8T2PGS4_9TELE|nr:hypothetical protein JZ751_026716 [Albula glossodonta]
MPTQRRVNVKPTDSNGIEKKIKRGNAQRQASFWKRPLGYLLVLIAFGACFALGWLYVSWDNEITETLVQQGCTPQICGRAVTDAVVTHEEAHVLRRLAERGLSLAGSDGGASILDLHSGALSMGKQFVNIYRYFGEQIKEVFSEEDFQLYRVVRARIQAVIAETFGLDPSRMYLTKPTFFSRMNSTEAKTTHDEYWHPHIDKVTYGSFDYTSLLYLSDYGRDFGGGRFIFMDADGNRTVEPRAGRVSFFSSGSENLHRVEKVWWGTRFAITVSFTCDPDHAIADPTLP